MRPNKTRPRSVSKDKLIQEINVLGPWIHGHFDLGNGLIIEDQDELHKKRITKNRDYFVDIISQFYKQETLESKTLCDVGCNAGFFLYELYNKFKFKHALGLEPRKTNLAKAQFIANYFGLLKSKYELRQFDILTTDKTLPVSDVVIMPGVLHHLSDHLQALRNLYKMTKELCIIETSVLPDYVNMKSIARHMSLGETIYRDKENHDKFGIVGYKLETNRLDGATYQSGIVGILSTNVLVMMMQYVGFDDVRVYHNDQQMRDEVYNERSYREYHSAIVIGIKNAKDNKKYEKYFDESEDKLEEQKFVNYIPLKFIEPLYKTISGQISANELETIPRLMYDSEIYYTKSKGINAMKNLQSRIGKRPYYALIQTFKHSPSHKISFEYAKTCYHVGNNDESLRILEQLIRIPNLDWRVVFMTYYLLAKIYFDIGNKMESKKYNALALRAHPGYSLARKLQKLLR